jgi:hypothetical protein
MVKTTSTTTFNTFSQRLAPALLIAAVLAAYTWATWHYYTRGDHGGNDFLANYMVWNAYRLEGLNPYSDEAVLRTQLVIYGRPAYPTEDQNRQVYPFYAFVIYAPFLFFDFPLARAMFMVALQAGLVLGVALTFQLVRWRPPLWLTTVVVGWSLLNYHEGRAVLLGQMAILSLAMVAGALVLLEQRRDAAAGALLVLTTTKPPLVFLLLPFLMLWALRRRRWRFVAGFAGGLAVALAVSFAMLPRWLGDWLLRVRQYPGYTVGQSPVWLLTHQALPWLGGLGELVLTAALLALLLWSWWRVILPGPTAGAEFHWTLALTLVISDLIVPRSATPNYVLLLLPTLWCLALLDRRGRAGRVAGLIIMLVLLVVHWWLHFATVVGNQEQAILFVPWPVLLGAALLVGRRWLIADARTARLWPDQEPVESVATAGAAA